MGLFKKLTRCFQPCVKGDLAAPKGSFNAAASDSRPLVGVKLAHITVDGSCSSGSSLAMACLPAPVHEQHQRQQQQRVKKMQQELESPRSSAGGSEKLRSATASSAGGAPCTATTDAPSSSTPHTVDAEVQNITASNHIPEQQQQQLDERVLEDYLFATGSCGTCPTSAASTPATHPASYVDDAPAAAAHPPPASRAAAVELSQADAAQQIQQTLSPTLLTPTMTLAELSHLTLMAPAAEPSEAIMRDEPSCCSATGHDSAALTPANGSLARTAAAPSAAAVQLAAPAELSPQERRPARPPTRELHRMEQLMQLQRAFQQGAMQAEESVRDAPSSRRDKRARRAAAVAARGVQARPATAEQVAKAERAAAELLQQVEAERSAAAAAQRKRQARKKARKQRKTAKAAPGVRPEPAATHEQHLPHGQSRK